MGKLTVEMSDQLDELLSAVATRRGLAKTQAIRRAVALMKFLDDAENKGEEIIIRSKSGDEKQLIFEPAVGDKH